jgi:hypothetical protein
MCMSGPTTCGVLTLDEDERFFTEIFDDWIREMIARGIHLYKNVAGEFDNYRLELTINDLAKVFLMVDTFAVKGNRQVTIYR